jgi:hypothetical protein
MSANSPFLQAGQHRTSANGRFEWFIYASCGHKLIANFSTIEKASVEKKEAVVEHYRNRYLI